AREFRHRVLVGRGPVGAIDLETQIADDHILARTPREPEEIRAARSVVIACDPVVHDAPQFSGTGAGLLRTDPPAIAEPQEERAPGAHDVDIGGEHLLHGAAVDRLPGDARLGAPAPHRAHCGRGTAQLEMTGQNPAKGSLGIRAELERVARAVDVTVLDQHVLGGPLRGALEAYPVVLGVDEAISYDDVPAAVDVDAVVVEIGL